MNFNESNEMRHELCDMNFNLWEIERCLTDFEPMPDRSFGQTLVRSCVPRFTALPLYVEQSKFVIAQTPRKLFDVYSQLSRVAGVSHSVEYTGKKKGEKEKGRR